MAKNVIGSPPFPLRVISSDKPLSRQQIRDLLGKEKGISFCLRSEVGPEKRGGYFFHIERAGDDFQIYDFEKTPIALLKEDHLVKFINHASGRQFDESMLLFSQGTVNLRQDDKKEKVKDSKKAAKII